jgi:hypothetical protein
MSATAEQPSVTSRRRSADRLEVCSTPAHVCELGCARWCVRAGVEQTSRITAIRFDGCVCPLSGSLIVSIIRDPLRVGTVLPTQFTSWQVPRRRAFHRAASRCPQRTESSIAALFNCAIALSRSKCIARSLLMDPEGARDSHAPTRSTQHDARCRRFRPFARHPFAGCRRHAAPLAPIHSRNRFTLCWCARQSG